MDTILVTGGAGFIGSHLVAEAVRRGFRVRVLDNMDSGTLARLAEAVGIPQPASEGSRRLRLTPQCELLVGDIRDAATCAQACESVSVMFHEAALRSVPRSVEDPLGTTDVNILGTLRLLMAARNAGLRRVVYASSSSVYGDVPDLPKKETQLPAPISPYAAAKLAGEHYCRVFSRLHGLSTVSLRYFNVFGPRQDPFSQYAAAIPRFISAIRAGHPVTIHGDGEQSRDFTYVDNVVAANFLAMEASSDMDGGVFNIAGGERITILDVVQVLGRIMGQTPQFIHTAPRPGDVRHTLADIEKARTSLGYRPGVSFEEGLRKTVAAFSTVMHETRRA